MVYRRSFIVVILGAFFFAGASLAQEENVTTATSALQSVLSTLKESVEKLNIDNNQLAAKNEVIKQQAVRLQAQLETLKAKGDALSNQVTPLQGNDPDRVKQINQLEENYSFMDNRTRKLAQSIKLIRQSMNTDYQQDQELLLQLKGMSSPPPAPSQVQSQETQEQIRNQKEKLKLMKMIYDSQQRQEALHESILDQQKTSPLLPAASALARQQFLKEQVKDRETQLASFSIQKHQANFGSADQWDNNQLRQLELELKVLEKNYKQLKVLMAQMTQKAQSTKMTVSQQIESEKLMGNIDELTRQGESLRAQLDDLRTQMVDLDKRKSRLEDMIQHLP